MTKAALREGHEVGRGEDAWTTDQINAYVKGTAQKLNEDFDTDQFKEGQTTADIFKLFTVHHLAKVIEKKMAE